MLSAFYFYKWSFFFNLYVLDIIVLTFPKHFETPLRGSTYTVSPAKMLQKFQ